MQLTRKGSNFQIGPGKHPTQHGYAFWLGGRTRAVRESLLLREMRSPIPPLARAL